MYFKRLEIFGFKSFGEKAILNFEPGITAVVGPNGCGKSNIFDAIRWVLGEQSVKELRGSTMGDCIFNGTDKRPGLGFAEVSLTFCNEPKVLPIEYGEVTVTRRLFRSGESEYLLNKATVRLKDILELFMGTGIGAESYSLIQQGKVDLIVNAKPEERRMLIDEAAGITKYKSKKKEALNKLKDAENNLLRINDIIIEVKRQIASLERQANKARKYKDEFEKLKKLETTCAKQQIDTYGATRTEVDQWLENCRTQESQLTAELTRLGTLVSQETEHLSQLEQKINEVRSDELKLENQIEINTKQISFNEERIAGLTVQEGRFQEQTAQLNERCRIQQEKIAAMQAALAALKDTVQRDIDELEVKKQQLTAIADATRDAKNAIKQDDERILELTTRQVSITNEATEVMKEFQHYLARKRRLEMENEKIISEKEGVDRRMQGICADIDGCSNKITGLKNQQQAADDAVAALKAQHHTLGETIVESENKRLFLTSQKEFIDRLQVQYQDIPDPVAEGTFLTPVVPAEHHQGIIGKVKDVRRLEGNQLDAVKNHFARLQHAELYEVTCETKFIELDAKLISAHIDELTRTIDAERQQQDHLAMQIKEQESQIASFIQAIHDEERILSRYEAQKNEILEESNKLVSELEVVTVELSEAKSALANLKAREDDLQGTAETIAQEIAIHKDNIQQHQQTIAAKTHEREETSVAIAQLETEIGLASDKEKGQQENLKIFEETLANGRQEMQRLEQDHVENQAKKQQFTAEIERLTVTIEELKQSKSSLTDVMGNHQQQKAEVNGRIEQTQTQLRSNEEKLQELRTTMHNQQLKGQEISFNEKSIKDMLMQTYKINFDEVDFTEYTLDTNAEELAAEIERVKKRCEAFGSVNLVAIEEFDALKERFEFLTKQQSDLITARESLHSTINKINRTTRQLFLDTFTRVSEEFRIYFRMLFGGGEAQLVLVDPENVLESGIDIIARPPGKKLQNISLLSGGEKSLAAIALIFGVFKVRPSPFCILDEIDAALDESNVGRFGYLLKDFSKIAQFIVITHNKKTIANANVMYGITMQETGISKLVSVKFNEEEEEKTQERVPAGV